MMEVVGQAQSDGGFHGTQHLLDASVILREGATKETRGEPDQLSMTWQDPLRWTGRGHEATVHCIVAMVYNLTIEHGGSIVAQPVPYGPHYPVDTGDT
jgi:hypothetical protein